MALKKREKILLIFVLIAVAIFLFDRFFDTPTNRKILTLKGEVKAADSKLSELALLSKGLETAETEIIRLEEELKGLSERTLRGEEFRAFLRHLARESDPLQMKVISIIPSEEKFSPSEEKKVTAHPDSRKVTVELVLHSTFAKLESYLKGIEELPFLAQIEGLQIERNAEVQPLLKVTLGLKMYIISL
jgi:regulatory protein YycI of two-component signal transduction system YycFG